jgi:aminoglycoside phosphotransferase (APT) family kinase protein
MSKNTVDITELNTYLEAHVEGFNGLDSIEKFAGGQSNPTYHLKADSGEYVLRRKPDGELLKSAHAVDREFRVIQGLVDTDVPVAKAFHLCEDDSIMGSMFYVMSFEPGRIFWSPLLPEVEQAERAPIYSELIRVLAAMHEVNLEKVGLSDYGRPGSYFERQINRWSRQYRDSETETIDAMETLLAWLPANMPADDGQVSLIHGDYRIDNVIFDPVEPKGLAVLDWELSTLGHPLADIAYFCMCLRLPKDGKIPGLLGVDRAAIGVPSEEEIVAQYCQARGIEVIENWNFYVIFSFFRLAAILQGVYKRALDGNASNSEALVVGKEARVLAELAIELI